MTNIRIPTRSHTIRFPTDLYEKIHILAEQNGRTFNGEIVYLLQVGYTVDRKYFDGVQQTKIEKEEIEA